MKKVLGVMLALCLVPVGIAASFALAGDHGQEQVTLCHAAGLAGTTQYVTITVGYPAAFGPAGHFDENGTPNAGHEQDYLGACEGDETTPTTTTPTTTTPTTPTVTEPPHVVTGAASVICDGTVYRISGTVDGQAADSVVPSVLPGSTKGTTNVIVTKGDTAFRTSVTTNGDCGPSTSTTPPANSTQPTTPPVTPPTATTPPDTTTSTVGGPAAGQPSTPPAEESSPGKPSEANPPVGAPAKPAPGKPCPPGTRAYQGRCHATVEGRG